MKCCVCGAESGRYPLCRACNQQKELGYISAQCVGSGIMVMNRAQSACSWNFCMNRRKG